MASNRLHLDFTINGTNERKDFVDKYIQRPEFIRVPLTEDELETIANYILWGKDSDGMSLVQKGDIQIETRNKTWQRNDTESLDALMESPTFNEASLRRPTEARTRIARETFDRKKAIQDCPSYMRDVFEELFERIDKLELGIEIWEFAHGKRKNPPREELTKKFGEDEVAQIQASAQLWPQYKYLKQRHLIVELRREQFTLRDSYAEKHLRHTPPEPDLEPSSLDFGAEVPVFPLGLVGEPFSDLAFRPIGQMYPKNFREEDIETLVKFYWQKRDCAKPQLYFDFVELEHVYQLVKQLNELEDEIEALPMESNLKKLLSTLKYYIEITELDEVQKEILDLKINKMKNQDIAELVNRKHGKTYTANYISTIFRQKILPQINDAARYHGLVVENICFEENFKRCSCCGEWKLISKENFMKRSRSKDGFSAKCKKCDRVDRQKKKEKIAGNE